jgi:hypothetical protein
VFTTKQALAAWLFTVTMAVDAGAGTVTLSVSEGRQPAVDRTYALVKDVEIGVSSATGGGRRGGTFKEGRLADLVPGAQATLVLSADQTSVQAVLAEGPTLRGAIKAVDLANNSLTVNLPPARGAGRGEVVAPEEKTFPVAHEAEVAVDDGRGRAFSIKEAKLGDLAVGSLATLRLSVDQKQALAVLVEGPTLNGLVKSVDPARNSLTLAAAPGRGGEVANEKSLDTLANVVVLLDDGKGRRFSIKEGKLADVPAGAAVSLKLSADQKTVASIRAEGATLVGLIKSVDADKGSIILAIGRGRGENPDERTLSLAGDAHVFIDGNSGKLSDVKVEERGPFAQVRLSLDQKTVQAIRIGAGRR